MEHKEKSILSDISQQIDEKYVESIINDRNSLLICLNQLLTNQSICNSNNILIRIHCNHFDDYVRYVSGKVIVNYLIEGKLNFQTLCDSQYWHCLPQFCQFLNRVPNRIPIGDCLGYDSIINVLLNKLSDDKYCDDHCICNICETMVQIICLTTEENVDQLLLRLIGLISKQKRCFIYKLIELMIYIIKESDENCSSIQTISIWVFQQNFFSEVINISDQFYGFGGKYLSDHEVMDCDYDCDVVLLRESVLLFLMISSSESFMKSNSDSVIKERFKYVTEFVRNKCPKFDTNDWIIKLFIEEDEQLLSAIYCLVRLGDNQLSHFIMNAFIESIDCDSSVLLDMLCDEQTATLLLKLLLIFLKLNDISNNISISVKNVLLELRHKMQRLTEKQLFPYNVKPLMRLLNKLKN